MSRDLTQQLAEYGRQHDDAVEAVTHTEVIGERTPRRAPIARHVAPVANGREIMMVDSATTPQGSKRARQLWMLGGAAAAVVALTVGGLVVLRADGDDPDDVLATSVTTATTATTAASRPTVDEPPPTTSGSTSAPTDATQSSVAPDFAAPVAVVPEDALGEAGDGVARPTVETPLPDFDAVELADSGDAPRMLTSVDDLPASARLDFLWEPGPCDEDGCFRDAHFRAADGSDLGAPWVAGEPFHIRHGFVNDSGSPLGQGFDLAVYAYSMPFNGGTREAPDSTRRYTADSVVLGETDACGPTYESQTGTVTCEWYVHDFPDGLPEGRWALWAVWEAPCLAWIDLGRTESCADPDEVMSFFSSGVDSPFVGRSVGGSGEPVVTEVGDWTRIDGADVFEVVSDGNVFFGTDGGSLLRSDDGITWEEHTELGEPSMLFESLFDFHGANFDSGPPAAIRDGRLVAVEDLRGTSVIVQIVDSDGTQSTQVVPVEIPVAYEPFHRELNPGVHLLDDGSIVITASYSADAGLVEATGRSRAELGLDLFYPMPRSIVVASTDGVTWIQQESPPAQVLSAATATGGLVARIGPVHVGHADRVVSFSADGATWEPVVDPDTGLTLRGGGPIRSTDNRAFLMDPERSRVLEIANGEARMIAGPGAAQEPLELFERFHVGRLAAGGAGLAYVVAVDEEMRDPAPDGTGIRYSRDSGETWEFDAFPAELMTGYPGGLAVGAEQIVLVHHGTSDGPTLWVRNFPGG